jgi:thiamine-monophosphate kinase
MIRSRFGESRGDGVEVGIGDDAAVLRQDSSADLLFCSDLSVEGIHFRTEWALPDVIGRKALAVTLSDIAAMGGQPRFALASVAFRQGSTREFIEQLFSGMFDLANELGFSLVGGDTSASPGPLFIDTSAIGFCGCGRAITRSGARPGDLVYVTGELGGSALGLQLLKDGFRQIERVDNPEERARQAAIKRHLAPEPRVRAGQMIGQTGLAAAMIDISDGLATDLGHITEDSKCGVVVEASLLPLAGALKELMSSIRPEKDLLQFALQSGEEYELAFCVRPEAASSVQDLSEELNLPITRIGEVIEGQGVILHQGELDQGGRFVTIDAKGFEHEI